MKLKVQHEGHEIEVEVADEVLSAAVADTHVPKTFMASEMKRRLATATKNLVDPEDILGDDQFKERALKEWGVSGKGKLDDEAVAKIRKNLEDTLVVPLKTEKEKLAERLGKLSKSQLHLEIVNAAREAGVKKEWLTPPSAGLPAPIIAMTESFFGQSADHGDGWFLRDGDSFAYAKEPKPNQPYKPVSEFISEFVSDASRAPTFLAEPQKVGPNNGRPGPAKPNTQGAIQGAASDPMTFGSNLEAIAKGAKVT